MSQITNILFLSITLLFSLSYSKLKVKQDKCNQIQDMNQEVEHYSKLSNNDDSKNKSFYLSFYSNFSLSDRNNTSQSIVEIASDLSKDFESLIFCLSANTTETNQAIFLIKNGVVVGNASFVKEEISPNKIKEIVSSWYKPKEEAFNNATLKGSSTTDRRLIQSNQLTEPIMLTPYRSFCTILT